MKTNTLYRTLLSFAAASLAVACATDPSTELTPNTESGEGTTLYASISNDMRVGFTENDSAGVGETAISLTWLDGDSFSVYDESGDYVGDFTYSGDDGVTSATFTSEATLYSNQTYTAVYPASTASTLDARDAEMTTETTQVGSAMTHLSKVCKMRDEFTLDEDISFTHEMAVLTAYFTSNTEYQPASLKVTIDSDVYTVNFSELGDSSGYYTHLMVAPCVISEGTTSLDFELLDTNGGSIYSNSTSTSMSIESGVRYKLALEPDMYDFIFTSDDLLAFAKSINIYEDDASGSGSNAAARARTAILFNDIDMEGVTWQTGNNEYVIGRRAYSYFTGTFDGNGKTIKNLSIDCQTKATGYGGLIGYIGHDNMSSDYKPVVKNVTIESPTLTDAYSYSAFVVGLASGSTIENCHVTGTALIEDANGDEKITDIGGIVGKATDSTIKNSSVDATITINNAGANNALIAGSASGSTIDNCSVEGSASITIDSAIGCVGGIVGKATDSTIQNTYVDCDSFSITSDVTPSGYIGGLVGAISGTDSKIYDCYIDGTATIGELACSFVGGIVGQSDGATIEFCSARSGDIVINGATSGQSYGGIAGAITGSSKIYACYNKATLYCNSRVGGIVGRSNGGDHIVMCYNNGDIYSGGQGGGVAGRVELPSSSSNDFVLYSSWTAMADPTTVGESSNAFKNMYSIGYYNVNSNATGKFDIDEYYYMSAEVKEARKPSDQKDEYSTYDSYVIQTAVASISEINEAVDAMNDKAKEYDSNFKYQFVAGGNADTPPTIVKR